MTVTAPRPPQSQPTVHRTPLEQYPEGSWEIIHGELIEMSPAGGLHGDAGMNLSTCLSWHVRQNKLGRVFMAETGFRLSTGPETILAPDWAFISSDRLNRDGVPTGFVEMVPDIILETRSPGATRREIASKVALWLTYGVKVVLDLDPLTEELHVHYPHRETEHLKAENTLTLEEFLPGFSVEIASIFE